jgi:hypothetical protein
MRDMASIIELGRQFEVGFAFDLAGRWTAADPAAHFEAAIATYQALFEADLVDVRLLGSVARGEAAVRSRFRCGGQEPSPYHHVVSESPVAAPFRHLRHPFFEVADAALSISRVRLPATSGRCYWPAEDRVITP